MASDPRQQLMASDAAAEKTATATMEAVASATENPTPAAVAAKSSILLGGEDDMDVDEDLPLPNASSNLEGKYDDAGSSIREKAGLAVLLDQIITPSPYPQLNSGPTSTRFRNALTRVLQRPDTDVEAWQALLTEVHTCYKNIPNVHAVDVETQAKLDWVESCYGHFLRYFPYAYTHAVTVVEILMKQSARWGEPDGPLVDYFGGGKVPKRAQICEAKLEGLLQEWLGITNMEGEVASLRLQESPTLPSDPSGTTTKESENGEPDHAKTAPTTTPITDPFNQRGHHLTGICSWVVELWLLYVKKRTRDATRRVEKLPMDQRAAHIRDAVKQAYEVALPHCGFSHNNHLLWVAYLDFIKSLTTTTTTGGGNASTPGTAEHVAATQQQMLQLRSVYQRLVTHPMTGLDQLWHEYEAWERSQSEALAQALSTEFAPKYQHARTVYLERNRVYNTTVELQLGQRLAVPPANPGEEDYASKIAEEHRLLSAWKKRCSYERTNPERLSPPDLAVRVRAAYKEMACVMTRHPETWQMWSTYELFRLGASTPSSSEARTVLCLGQELIPNSTLLVYAEAHIVELYTINREDCMKVMERSLDRFPTTLGYVLYQQMIRRYKGADDARAVFARARRVLADPESSKQKDGADPLKVTEPIDETTGDQDERKQDLQQGVEHNSTARWMVTNKLDPLIGKSPNGTLASATDPVGRQKDAVDEEKGSRLNIMIAGPMTWHLYAAHASMEHRINRCPEIAARVYELGLRKHSSFLTKAPYVIRYAELLLELGDTMNLRALLTRAVAACDANKGKSEASLASLWDMTLRFETIMSGADPDSLANLENIERQRRQAIMGADLEDVATGGFVGIAETPLIGAQKSSISEHLIRTEGYDISSGIVNGLCRMVDLLEVNGLWGSGESTKSWRKSIHTLSGDQKSGADDGDDMPGGASDSSYYRRLEFANFAASGGSPDGLAGDSNTGGSRLLTARERLQQAGSATGTAGPTSAIMLSIQQMPEWLRPLLLMLPASRNRLPIVAKPAPHIVEITITTLKQNALPTERPIDVDTSDNKRKSGSGGNSSDEEGGGKSSGYGIAFRARQRARMSGGLHTGGS
ncbi:hypothetical protein ACA910_004154 [Epithemia clementina (nom. ined.)]